MIKEDGGQRRVNLVTGARRGRPSPNLPDFLASRSNRPVHKYAVSQALLITIAGSWNSGKALYTGSRACEEDRRCHNSGTFFPLLRQLELLLLFQKQICQ